MATDKYLTFEPPPFYPGADPDTMGIDSTMRYPTPPILNRDSLARDADGTSLGSDLQVGDWICLDSHGLQTQKIAAINDPP